MKKYALLLIITTISLSAIVLLVSPYSSKILTASELIGLEFTEPEVDSMEQQVRNQVSNYESIREKEIKNEIFPSVVFRPDFFQEPTSLENKIQVNWPEKVELPINKEELAFYTIKELAWLIKNQKITPIELTKIYIDRLKKYGDTLECVITITEERAQKQAKKATEEINNGKYRGWLHGIPYGAKDLLAVEGYKTTWGAKPYKNQELEQTAKVIKKLDEAGAILIAKLTLGALAYGDVWYDGITKNPWNLNQGSSGSSAGSGSATSAGLVAFSLRTETYGSIVSPSTRCGVSGLRPTFGGVSRYGAMALSWTMDKIGPICRSAEDCAFVFDVIKGKDKKDPYSLDYGFHYSPGIKKSLNIAYCQDLFSSSKGMGKKNDSIVIAQLTKAGFEVSSIDWFKTEIPVNDLLLILYAEGAAAFDELTRSNQDDEMVRQGKFAWPNLFRASRFIPAVEYIQANRLRTQLISEYIDWISQYDVVIVPSFAGNQLLTTNLTGHPTVVVPNGYNDQGSPTSISFIGNYYEEGKLLEVTRLYQDMTSFDDAQPPLFAVR